MVDGVRYSEQAAGPVPMSGDGLIGMEMASEEEGTILWIIQSIRSFWPVEERTARQSSPSRSTRFPPLVMTSMGTWTN